MKDLIHQVFYCGWKLQLYNCDRTDWENKWITTIIQVGSEIICPECVYLSVCLLQNYKTCDVDAPWEDVGSKSVVFHI